MQSATAEDIQAEVDKGADIGAGDEEGYTPLHFAAYWGNAETVTALLNAGANGKARTEDDKTPFDLAKEEGKLNGTDAYWLLNEAQYLPLFFSRDFFCKTVTRKISLGPRWPETAF